MYPTVVTGWFDHTNPQNEKRSYILLRKIGLVLTNRKDANDIIRAINYFTSEYKNYLVSNIYIGKYLFVITKCQTEDCSYVMYSLTLLLKGIEGYLWKYRYKEIEKKAKEKTDEEKEDIKKTHKEILAFLNQVQSVIDSISHVVDGDFDK